MSKKLIEIKIIDDIKYKECTKCKEWKSFDEYSKNSSSKLGIHSGCKVCEKKYRENNKELISNKNKEYYENNKEYFKEYIENNKEYIKEYQKNKYYTNPEFRLISNLRSSNYTNLQRAIKYYLEDKIHKLPSKSPSRLLLKLYEIQNHICPYCSSDMRDNIHIDHITPLSKNGSNDVENLILCCSSCNLSKNAKDLEDWLKECNINYKEFIGSIERRNKIYFSEEIISA